MDILFLLDHVRLLLLLEEVYRCYLHLRDLPRYFLSLLYYQLRNFYGPPNLGSQDNTNTASK